MELTNSFRVPVAINQAWDVLTDVERIAPCLPGAQLQEVTGDEYRGIVKVKVGPITAQYKGSATFVEQDKDAGRAVLKAEGRDIRGQGNASALITATLKPDGDGTDVNVVTDLTITGRVAQFGRGVLADVSSKLLGQFVECLENDLLGGASGDGDGSGGAESAPESTESPNGSAGAATNGSSSPASAAGDGQGQEASTRRIEGHEPEPVDLLEAAGVPVAKRAIPIVAAVLVVIALVRVWRRRKRRR